MGHFENGACFGPDSFFHCKKRHSNVMKRLFFSLNVMKRFIFSLFFPSTLQMRSKQGNLGLNVQKNILYALALEHKSSRDKGCLAK